MGTIGFQEVRPQQPNTASILADSIQIVINRFNTFNPGANLFFFRDGTIVPYIVIWKCVSNGIILNLNLLTVNRFNSTTIKHQYIESHEQFEMLLSAQSSPYPMSSKYLHTAQSPPEEKLKAFTFVREPFERFISGFTESVYFTFKVRKHFEADNKTFQRTNVTAVRDYLKQILNYKIPLVLMGHFYPMAGVLFKFHVATLGLVENFQKDWETVIKPQYNIRSNYKAILGMHETSVHHPKVAGNDTIRLLSLSTPRFLAFLLFPIPTHHFLHPSSFFSRSPFTH
jgi:hypothetical protein